MTLTACGTYPPGDYVLIRSAGAGDSVVLSNNGPGVVFVTAAPLGKDYKLQAKSFAAWRCEKGTSLAINVQNGSCEVALQWLPASIGTASPIK